MSDDAQQVELHGPDNEGWYTSQTADWIPLCPDLSDSAVRLYWIMRALIVEKRGPVRKLTLPELCYLLPAGAAGKTRPSSLSRIRALLDQLGKVGLVTTPEGGRLKTSSRARTAATQALRIRVNERPRGSYKGPRNAFAALDTIRPEAQRAAEDAAEREARLRAEKRAKEREERAKSAGQDPLEGVGQNSGPPPVGQNSDPQGQDSGPRGQNPGPETGVDQRRRDLPYSPPVHTSLSDPAGPSSPCPTVPGDEREKAAPDTHLLPGQRAETSDTDVQQVVDAYATACRRAGVMALRRVTTTLAQQARELLSEGASVEWLAARASEMPAKRWTDLTMHASRSAVPMAKTTPSRRSSLDRLDCPRCFGSGIAEDPETRLPVGPCPCLNSAPAAAGR